MVVNILLTKRRRLSPKNAKLLRPTLFNYIATRDEFETYTNELFGFITKDKLDVRIHEVYPLAEVARAHEVGTDIQWNTEHVRG